MKKSIVIGLIIIFFVIIIEYNKTHITLNLPINSFTSGNVTFEDDCNNLINNLLKKNNKFLDGYKLAYIRYSAHKDGYIMYSNINNYSVIMVYIEDNLFTRAIKYSNNSRFANKSYRSPINSSLIKINTEDLFKIVYCTDDNFNSNNIDLLELDYEDKSNLLIWRCIYKADDYYTIKVNATTGEVISTDLYANG